MPKGKRKSQSQPSKIPHRSSKSSNGKPSKGHTKKKRRTGGNVVGGSKAVDPKHNAKVNAGLITSVVFDEVNPELEVACKREINVKGSYLKPREAHRRRPSSPSKCGATTPRTSSRKEASMT